MRGFLVNISFFVLCMGAAVSVYSQSAPDPKKTQLYIVPGAIVDGDTIPYLSLRPVSIIGHSKVDLASLDRLTRNVMKAYPYAKLTRQTLDEIERELSGIQSKRERKRYIDWAEDQMKEAFEQDLKKLTYSQGRILIKLVNRETGKTSYELVKQLKGGFSAFMWQGVAKLFGANLKSEFNPQAEDYVIEVVVNRIESGELPVAQLEPRNLVRNH